jgi:Ni,Fe-hydrogenase III component G
MENEQQVNKNQLLSAVQKKLDEKWRFAMMTALDSGDRFEILYTFEPAEAVSPLSQLRVAIPKNEALLSITGIYPSAVVAENEIAGDFKIEINGISIDFNKTIMHTKDSLQFPLTKTPPVPKVKEGEVKP